VRLSRILFTLLLGIFPAACVQTENSNSQDKDQYGGGGSALFKAARTILTQSCSSCHLFHTKSEDALVADGVMVKGDAEGSQLYFRLNGSSGTGGPKNMPTGGSLSIGDLNTIKDWIDNAN
jgi:hypothetical protein